MTLLERPQERLNKRGGLETRPRSSRRSTLVALLLACAVLIVLDLTSPALTPLRSLAGEIYGPLETGAATVARPVTSIPDWARTQGSLRADVRRLKAENADLTQKVQTSDYGRNRLAEYDGLMSEAQDIGYAVVPAHVVGYGAAQSFERTITIDAGSDAGIAADMTVVAAKGLVGRVLRVTRSTATVLLIADADSVVGGRVGSTMEAGFLHGTGVLGSRAKLDLELIDQTDVPEKGDTVVTWGSGKGAPYISGVPIGVVDSVYSNLRDSTQHVRVTPYVSFSSLDLVGVAVPSGTKSDRAVIDVDGELK
ncbi:rod shape-determining protein MreC [Nocardioides sp. Kera G14]|uniref:rod shape-determining protein MreC n=1 Tax=Nocardioides sp. Kera G14 TaxID=2884264 RepID=UPI001D12495A|nr:rod shape-determining protein MreC [Nocardioides sp. Kera G14]UDY24493.1 rod shape-determining protein MreC [Nocardioides sp. Kera G14]